MKKIIILIFLIGAFINQSYGQKGITAHFIRSSDYISGSGAAFEKTSGNGFALGYMYYKNDRQFKQLKLSFTQSTVELGDRYTYDDSGIRWGVSAERKYNTLIFSYEKYSIWGNREMDDANICYGYKAWDLISETESSTVSSGGISYAAVTGNDSKRTPFDVGFRLGLGFQHNFSHKMGAFIDFNIGLRFINIGYIANTNIGVRMNLQ